MIQMMWLGYPGTSGASFMDYIITDKQTSPLSLAAQYSEQLAWMPHTFFIGDHMRMFPHLKERIIMADSKDIDGSLQDNVAVINAVDTQPIKDVATLAKVSMESNMGGEVHTAAVTVAELATTQPINNMIRDGQVQTNVNAKAATGEEVPEQIMVTTRQQYGLPDDAIV